MEPPVALQNIDHFVIVLMENRSFDHVLGYLSLPDANFHAAINGIRADQGWQDQYINESNGASYSLHSLTPTLQNIYDPPHDSPYIKTQIQSPTQGNRQAQMGGFVKSYATAKPAPSDLSLVMGYYKKDAVPTFDFFARNFAVCDRWFSSLPSGTQVNRLMAMAGQSAISDNVSSIFQFPDQALVYDWLNKNNVDWCTYQWRGFPFFTLMNNWREKILFSLNDEEGLSHFRWSPWFAQQWKAGQSIPSVVFIEPEYTNTPFPLDPNDDHSPTGVAKGQVFLAQIYNTLTSNPRLWAKTMLIVTYDEHGGFFDHEPPMAVPCLAGTTRFETTGVRVPGFVVSPYVRPGLPISRPFDHTSILSLLAERFTPGTAYSPAVAERQTHGFEPLSAVLTEQPQQLESPLLTDSPSLENFLAAHPQAPLRDDTEKAFEDAVQEMKAKHPDWLTKPQWLGSAKFLAQNALAAIERQPGTEP